MSPGRRFSLLKFALGLAIWMVWMLPLVLIEAAR